MAIAPTILGRPSERKDLIARQLRDQIVAGQMSPGSQLPTRSEIEKLFQASPGTVQSALEHLRRDGFIVVNGRQGTFVSQHPPHLTNYALVFAGVPTDNRQHGGRFWMALANEAIAMQNAGQRNISSYYNINEHGTGEDYKRLMSEVRAHRLAGIIFGSAPFLIRDTPIFEEPGIPRVAIGPYDLSYGMSSISLDNQSFWRKALQYLVSRGRRRVAVIMPPHEERQKTIITNAMIEAGVTPEPHWIQGVHLAAPELARNLVQLMFHPGQQELPDGLVIADDNLVEHVTGGLMTAGVRVPDNLEVVAHCNFPWPTPSVLPSRRLGYDARQVLDTALSIIDRERQGTGELVTPALSAYFEDELHRSS